MAVAWRRGSRIPLFLDRGFWIAGGCYTRVVHCCRTIVRYKNWEPFGEVSRAKERENGNKDRADS